MAEELRAVRAQIASPRLTQIVDGIADLDDESLIEPGMMVVTLTRDGYVKRTPLDTFRAQHRGGRGRSGARRRAQDDMVVRSFIAHTHQWVLFFTSRGIAFREKVWQLPEGGAPGQGPRRCGRCCSSAADEQVTAVLPLPQDETLWDGLHLVFATAGGNVRRNRLSDFRNVRAVGLIAMKLDEGDELIGVQTCREGDDVLLATRKGRVHPLHSRRRAAARLRRARQLRRARHPARAEGPGDRARRAAPRRGERRRARDLPARSGAAAARGRRGAWRRTAAASPRRARRRAPRWR